MKYCTCIIPLKFLDSDGEVKMASSSEEEDDEWIYEADGMPSKRLYVIDGSDQESEAESDPVLSENSDVDEYYK